MHASASSAHLKAGSSGKPTSTHAGGEDVDGGGGEETSGDDDGGGGGDDTATSAGGGAGTSAGMAQSYVASCQPNAACTAGWLYTRQ